MNSYIQRLMSGLTIKVPFERPTMKLWFNIENIVTQKSFRSFRSKNKVERFLKMKSV